MERTVLLVGTQRHSTVEGIYARQSTLYRGKSIYKQRNGNSFLIYVNSEARVVAKLSIDAVPLLKADIFDGLDVVQLPAAWNEWNGTGFSISPSFSVVIFSCELSNGFFWF
jgi:hypothetical protein